MSAYAKPSRGACVEKEEAGKMDKQLQENMPIYMQIMQKVREAIASGELAPGARVASVRERAGAFAVNERAGARGTLGIRAHQRAVCDEGYNADRRDAPPACGGGRGAVSQRNADVGIQRDGDAGVFSRKCG